MGVQSVHSALSLPLLQLCPLPLLQRRVTPIACHSSQIDPTWTSSRLQFFKWVYNMGPSVMRFDFDTNFCNAVDQIQKNIERVAYRDCALIRWRTIKDQGTTKLVNKKENPREARGKLSSDNFYSSISIWGFIDLFIFGREWQAREVNV